jgi:hypothetical protein
MKEHYLDTRKARIARQFAYHKTACPAYFLAMICYPPAEGRYRPAPKGEVLFLRSESNCAPILSQMGSTPLPTPIMPNSLWRGRQWLAGSQSPHELFPAFTNRATVASFQKVILPLLLGKPLERFYRSSTVQIAGMQCRTPTRVVSNGCYLNGKT